MYAIINSYYKKIYKDLINEHTYGNKYNSNIFTQNIILIALLYIVFTEKFSSQNIIKLINCNIFSNKNYYMKTCFMC